MNGRLPEQPPELPGNAGLYQQAYRQFERVVAATLEAGITAHTADALQAVRTDAENRTFQRAPRPEDVESLRNELNAIFDRLVAAANARPADMHTADVIRVISMGRGNAFFTLERGGG